MEITDVLSRNKPDNGYQPEAPVIGSQFDFPKSRTEYVPDGLPLEEPDMSYYAPLSFEEMAEALTHDVLRLSDYAAIENRFSESYLDISRQLEKGISELASLCVTRSVFEKQGVRFTMLKELNLDICAGIIRYHFRKSHDAAQKTEIQNQKFWKQMVEMETRWYHLAKRIDATGDRIDLIRSGKISVDSLIKDYERRKIRNAEGHPKREKPASACPKSLPPASAVSFPVIGEFLSGQPAAVSVQQTGAGKDKPEEIYYPSMKARKKAERLARKQAREAVAADRKNMNSGTRRHLVSHNGPEPMQDPFAPGSGTGYGSGNCGYKDPSSRHSARSFREPAAFPCEDYSPGERKRGIPPERV